MASTIVQMHGPRAALKARTGASERESGARQKWGVPAAYGGNSRLQNCWVRHSGDTERMWKIRRPGTGGLTVNRMQAGVVQAIGKRDLSLKAAQLLAWQRESGKE